MIKIEDVEVVGIRKAIKGMRNAMNSWDKSDSMYMVGEKLDGVQFSYFKIGEKDMKLCKNLIKAGSSDRKFLRMIHVQADVTAPLYMWKQIDQYRIGVTTNSTSTMHTIHKRDLTIDDFSHEHLISDEPVPCKVVSSKQSLMVQIYILNKYREMYLEYKDKEYWWQIIQLLPSSFNQMRTIDLNYETLFSIYHQRKGHKLDEWREFCKWIETLPYMKEFLGLGEQTEKGRENDKEV